ncbi:unnamed protein product, partial [Chrysoparadoxa australica]
MNPNKKNKKILWTVPRSFLPVSDGASKANKSLLATFRDLEIFHQFDVTLLLFLDEEDFNTERLTELESLYKREFKINSVKFAKKKTLSRSFKRVFQVLLNFLSKDALTAGFFNLKENQSKLKNLAKDGYDFVLFDGLHPYCGLRKIFGQSELIYRSHNVEYELWKGADANFLTRFLFNYQGNKIKKLESYLIKKARKTWTISQEDKDTYLKEMKSEIFFLPMAQEFQSLRSREFENGDKKPFVFVGKLDWHPNTEGLFWLLDKVVPLLDTSVKIKIVGKGNFPKSNYEHLKNVEFVGFVDDLAEFYNSCEASLIPIFSGSGTR